MNMALASKSVHPAGASTIIGSIIMRECLGVAKHGLTPHRVRKPRKGYPNNTSSECVKCVKAHEAKRPKKVHKCPQKFWNIECKVPCCKAQGGPDISLPGRCQMQLRKNKHILCGHCYQSWSKKHDSLSWKEFVPVRTKELNRPNTFQNPKHSIVPVQDRCDLRAIEVCRNCSEKKEICQLEYQYCRKCMEKEQFSGKKVWSVGLMTHIKTICWCCGVPNDDPDHRGLLWSDDEDIFVCSKCWSKSQSHKGRLPYPGHHKTPFQFIKENILPIKECDMCDVVLTFNGLKDEPHQACIDHIHVEDLADQGWDPKEFPRGRYRGVVCKTCNMYEGVVTTNKRDPKKWGNQCFDYRQKGMNPSNVASSPT